MRDDIGIIIEGSLDFIKQLRSYRTDCDTSSGVFLFGQYTFAVVINLGNRKANVQVLAGLQQVLKC